MSNFTFTVLIPTHNRASILPRAVRSVLAQTFRDFELLIVDDASTDETSKIVEALSDGRIRYIRRGTNGGAAATRNTGIREARGRFISFLDDDDEYDPAFLSRTLEYFAEHPTAGFSWCGVEWVRDTENGEVTLKREIWNPAFKNKEHAYLAFLKHRRIGTNCGVSFRRTTLQSFDLFDESFAGGAEDNDFFIRLIRTAEFVVVPDVLIKIHLHSNINLRSYTARKAEDYERIIQKNMNALLNHPELWSSLHYKTGWLYYHGGNRSRGRQYLLKAIRKMPFSIKNLGALIFFETFGRWAPRLHKQISHQKRFFLLKRDPFELISSKFKGDS